MNHVDKTFEKGVRKCLFLKFMSFLTSFLLVVLNVFIGYEIIQSFMQDGFSFLGGLFIAASYIITLPALFFSIIQIRLIKSDHEKKHFFPIIYGTVGVLTGLLLINAVGWWYLVVIFHVFLILSSLVCGGKSREKEIENKSSLSAVEPLSAKGDINNVSYKILVVFQFVGLAFLLIMSIPVSSESEFSKDYHIASTQQLSIVSLFLFLLHGIVTTAFILKKKWALNFKYYESYILLGLTIFLFLVALLAGDISFKGSSFAVLILFVLLMILFIYLIFSYKKLRKT